MAIYDLDLDNVTEAMIDASKRGVRVRVVTDTDNLKNEPIAKLKEAKIPIIDDKRSAIMHHKFAVVDGEAVWMGSWNFTVYDSYRYNNNGALWRNRPLAQVPPSSGNRGKFAFVRATGSRPHNNERGVRIEAYPPADNPSPTIIRRIRGRTAVVFSLPFTHEDRQAMRPACQASRSGVSSRRPAPRRPTVRASIRRFGMLGPMCSRTATAT
jgi:hypothetical protein